MVTENRFPAAAALGLSDSFPGPAGSHTRALTQSVLQPESRVHGQKQVLVVVNVLGGPVVYVAGARWPNGTLPCV